MNDEERFGPKGNNPPSDEQLLREYLEERSADLRRRYDDLLASVERMPSDCGDDETAGKLGDMAKLLSTCAKSFDDQRETEKKPYLTLGRAVDGYFKIYAENIDKAKRRVLGVLSPYLKRKEEEARQAALEEARKKREEAERLATEAASLAAAHMTQAAAETINEAARMDSEATKETKKAEGAKAAELSRTRGAYGSLANLRTVWVGEITDRGSLDIVRLLPYLSLDALQKALNAYVKAGNKELQGARIYEDKIAQVK